MIRERHYEASNLNNGFFKDVEKRYKGFQKKEWLPVREGHKTRFGFRHATYNVIFEEDRESKELALKVEAEVRKDKLPGGHGDESELIKLLQDVKKWSFFDKISIEKLSFNEAYVYIGVKIGIKEIPLGKKDIYLKISTNLYLMLLGKLINIYTEFLRIKQQIICCP